MKKLSTDSLIKLKHILMQDEGFRSTPYKDIVGKLTIGYGRNLEDVGISEDEAIYMLNNDIENSINDLKKVIKNYEDLSENRKIVLINMMFNLGLPKFITFKKMISAILNGNDQQAAKEMLQSNWAEQVGDRAVRLNQLWLNG